MKRFLNPPPPKLRGKQKRLKEESEQKPPPTLSDDEKTPEQPTPVPPPSSTPSLTRRFAQYEWFYSDMDYPFFYPTINEFSLILRQDLRCDRTHMTRDFWRVLRALIGPPRLLSKHYLAAQRAMLAAYRENICRVRNGEDASHNIPFDWIPTGCYPGSRVLVIHPKSRELCSAVISQIVRNESVVRFFQTSLGTSRVPNVDIMPHAQAETLQAPPNSAIPAGEAYVGSTYTYSNIINVDPSSRESIINNQIDMRILLEMKEETLRTIRVFNSLVHEYLALGRFSDIFLARYSNLFSVLIDLENLIKARHTSITRSSLCPNVYSPSNGEHLAPLAPSFSSSSSYSSSSSTTTTTFASMTPSFTMEQNQQFYQNAMTILSQAVRQKNPEDSASINPPPESVLRSLVFVLKMGSIASSIPLGSTITPEVLAELRSIVNEFIHQINPSLHNSNSFKELVNYLNSKLSNYPS